MATNTFQVWAEPVSDPSFEEYADHTFVYCPDNGQYFGCWAGGQITDGGAVLVASSTQTNTFGNSSYDTANCYRTPVTIFGTTHPDTAGVGMYGVNGVCHQSANLFYWAVSNTPYNANADGRPNGYWPSRLAYGWYGALTPGNVPTEGPYHLAWLGAFYTRCRGLFGSSSAEAQPSTEVRVASPGTLAGDLDLFYRSAPAQKLSSAEMLAREFAISSKHLAPGVNLESFEPIHAELLRQKDALIASDRTGSGAIGEQLAERINDLVVTMQEELEKAIGAPDYEALTGLQRGHRIRVVDPRIASGG